MADMLIVRVYLLFLWIVLYPNALIYLIGLITRIPRRRENTSSCFTTPNESRIEVTRASGGVIDAPTVLSPDARFPQYYLHIHVSYSAALSHLLHQQLLLAAGEDGHQPAKPHIQSFALIHETFVISRRI